MAYAKKCDRCGAFYDTHVVPTEGRIHGGVLSHINTLDRNCNVDQSFDLCNNCWVDFLDDFMKKSEKDE